MPPEAVLAGVRVGGTHPPRVMGVVNVSPESFFAGSVPRGRARLAAAAREMEAAGADFIDVGAMSTAPYLKTHVAEEREAERLAGAVRVLRRAVRIPISVDTSRFGPARAAFNEGADILNDVRALRHDPRLPALAARMKGVILMAHPANATQPLRKPVADTLALLRAAVAGARKAGVPEKRIVMDPGIGFFRTSTIDWWEWDLEILRRLDEFRAVGRPLLVGVSRKSFIGKLSGGIPAADRLPGSLAAALSAVMRGAAIIRAHDVAETRRALDVWQALRHPAKGSRPQR